MRGFNYQSFLKAPIPEEDEIISNWKGEITKPTVSIICVAYNHELYLEDALKGFLTQKTDFPYEIIVHDDASTDGTCDIIERYYARYPRIIKPIFQRENQYSQGKRIIPLAASYAKGEFYALCEGDDFWFDENKLSMQYEVLKNNKNVDLCFHAADMMTPTGYKHEALSKGMKSKFFEAKDLVKGGGGFCATCSLFIRGSVFESLPDWLNSAPYADYFIQVLSARRGGARYIGKSMSCYRSFSIGSYSEVVYSNREGILWNYEGGCVHRHKLLQLIGNEYSFEIDYADALAAYSAARRLMLIDDLELASSLIKISWSKRKFACKGQVFLFVAFLFARYNRSLVRFLQARLR